MSAPKTYFMKTTLLAVIFSTSLAAPLFADGTNVFSDDKSKMSYAVGMIFGHNLQQQGIDVDGGQLLRGIKDEQSGGATLLTPQEAQAAIKDFQEKIRAELAVKNMADGTAFLATNKNNPGVITLPDGLQYKVITDGTGATPTADSLVTVNYRGAFLDGREFDSSYKRGQPAQFPVHNVIHGWTEALTQMKVGSKWQLFIPSNLAYGVQGHPPTIPPNATLVFEVELLDAHPAPAQTPAISPPAPLTSDIIKVPSAEEMKKGAKIETIKQGDLEKLQSEAKTN
jgi:FKBP-type peptidyl-prolyl cis-trans isomerase FklB